MVPVLTHTFAGGLIGHCTFLARYTPLRRFFQKPERPIVKLRKGGSCAHKPINLVLTWPKYALTVSDGKEIRCSKNTFLPACTYWRPDAGKQFMLLQTDNVTNGGSNPLACGPPP